MAAFGQDVVSVVEALGLKRVVLIGHSLGGPAVLEAARRMPGRVAGLVLVGWAFLTESGAVIHGHPAYAILLAITAAGESGAPVISTR